MRLLLEQGAASHGAILTSVEVQMVWLTESIWLEVVFIMWVGALIVGAGAWLASAHVT